MVLSGCRTGHPSDDALRKGAYVTASRYIVENTIPYDPDDASADDAWDELHDVDRKYWAFAIWKLDPIRVYEQNGNLLVVEGESGEVEMGRCILTGIHPGGPRVGRRGFIAVEGSYPEGILRFERTVGD